MVHMAVGGDAASAAALAACRAENNQGAFLMTELGKIAPKISHEQLREQAALATLTGLRLLEDHAKSCVQLLVRALYEPESAALAQDAAWVLNKLVRLSDAAMSWAQEAKGAEAMMHCLTRFGRQDSQPSDSLPVCGGWTVFYLGGLAGLVRLLEKHAEFGDSMLIDLLWVVHDVVRDNRNKDIAPTPESVELLQSAVFLMKSPRGETAGIIRACCAVCDICCYQEPEMAKRLAAMDALPSIMKALTIATQAGAEGNDLALSCISCLAALADADSSQKQALCQAGFPRALAAYAANGHGLRAEERALHALGGMAGIRAVVEAMQQAENLPCVVRGALQFVTETAGGLQEQSDLTLLPDILQMLLDFQERLNGAQCNDPEEKEDMQQNVQKAICSVMCGLAPHLDPGQLPVFDGAVLKLINGLNRPHIEEWSIAGTLEMIGRVALAQPKWIEVFKQQGVLSLLLNKVDALGGHKKLMKYHFWMLGALAGLPVVIETLQHQMQHAERVDAALCTIIDILDEDVEGEWVLASHATRCKEGEVPGCINIVCEGIGKHQENHLVACRGCHCLGLLTPLAPAGSVPPRAVGVACQCGWQHRDNASVLRDVAFALRAYFNSLPSCQLEAAKQLCVDHGASALMAHALSYFGGFGNMCDMLEDAVFVLSMVASVPDAVRTFMESHEAAVHAAGAKALFELGRQRRELLAPHAADVVTATRMLAEKNHSDEAFRRNAELLIGLCMSF
eukprot:TRINITY_DN27741_c0_g1_i1.p1 TRINITY_DN27741_c0_g1~~TRINITY_DN27741_c0_g1_i1.p1  ORF type:complete len:738 (-),score=168.50 TRINITY_DN27741_c0_g1_i1:62-2275(-)